MERETTISLILDESGSMSSVKEETIRGFNDYVDSLKSEADAENIRFSLTLFNSERVNIVYSHENLSNVEKLNDENYTPSSMTPLYDAIGKTIRKTEKQLWEKEYQKVLIVIQTDGFENDSREFNRNSIFKLIDEKKKKGWVFLFLGADQDAWETGSSLGIARGNTMSYEKEDTDEAFVSIKKACHAFIRLPDNSSNIKHESLFDA